MTQTHDQFELIRRDFERGGSVREVRNAEITDIDFHPARGRLETDSSANLGRALAPIFVFVLAVAAAYGYEIFSFHLTIDEESFSEATNRDYAQVWLSQGRWAMAALTLLIPSPVVPAVSTLIGVALMGLAFWHLCRRYLDLGPWPTVLVASVAATLPTLAFMFSFSTIAYGIGIGYVLLVAYFCGMSSHRWLHRAAGVMALSFSIGIYDTFLVAAGALAVVLILARPRWATILWVSASLGVALVLSRAVAALGQIVRGLSQDPYTSQFVDLAGLVSDPVGRLRQAVSNVLQVISLSADRFGLHSPWLALVVVALILLAAIGAIRSAGTRMKIATLAALIVILTIPIGIEAVSPTPVLLRSMIYMPVIIIVLGALAISGVQSIPKLIARPISGIVCVAMVLAVIGQVTISNRLFGAAETTYAQDQNLAFVIGMEKERLAPTAPGETVPVVMSGTHSWPEAALTPSRETLGVSFFAGLGGPDNMQQRNAAFLRSQGVAVRVATDAEVRGSDERLDAMPSYPAQGWVTYEHGVLLVKFAPSGGM